MEQLRLNPHNNNSSSSIKILLVDDDEDLLEGLSRKLSLFYEVGIATGAKEAWSLLNEGQRFDIIISDQQMPGDTGVTFLKEIRKKYEDTIRVMLSGEAGFDDAIDAVNEGQIFRFLRKPCKIQELQKTIEDAIELKRLKLAEKELLEKTLRGSIKMMTEILSLVSPVAFGRTLRLHQLVLKLGNKVNYPRLVELELATLLSHIGCVSLPEKLLRKVFSGESLTSKEEEDYINHPLVASEIISHIPRLEYVTKLVKYQNLKANSLALKDLNQEELAGLQILKLAIDFDAKYYNQKFNIQKVEEGMEEEIQKGNYTSDIAASLLEEIDKKKQDHPKTEEIYDVSELISGMEISKEVYTKDGLLLLGKGYTITSSLKSLITSMCKQKSISYPIVIMKSQNIKE